MKDRVNQIEKTMVKVKEFMIEATPEGIEIQGNRNIIQKLYDNRIYSKPTLLGLMR